MKFKPSKLAITIAVMIFIFIHSAMPATISGVESGWFVEKIAGLLRGLGIPVPGADQLSFIVRKCAHFTEFMVLGWSLCNLLSDHFTHSRKLCWTCAWFAGTLYAVTDEIHQIFVPERGCSFRDVCIDAAGVACGAAITALILEHRR